MIGNSPVVGRYYRHYKGGVYQVIALARIEETLQPAVVYQALPLTKNECWIRTVVNWLEIVDGRPRFQYEPDIPMEVCGSEHE